MTNKLKKVSDKPADEYELRKDTISSKLIRFMNEMKKNKYDEDLNNYQLLGKLYLEEANVDHINKKIKYNLITNKRLNQHILYNKITLKEINELCKNYSKDGKFKCVCKQQLKYVYVIKHIELEYLLIVGVCCYKSIRKVKTHETLCLKCNLPLGHKKSIFHCKECLEIVKKEKKEKKLKEEIIEKQKIKDLNEKIEYYGEMTYKSFGKFKDFKIKDIPLWYAPWMKQKYINENKSLSFINNLLTYYQLIHDKEHL